MSRRLRTVAAVAALALGTVTATVTTSAAAAAPTPASGPGARQQAFTAAAAEFGVPAPLLEAVSYAQTRWEGHAGEHNTSGGYGPMNLVDATVFTADVAQQRDGGDPRRPCPARSTASVGRPGCSGSTATHCAPTRP